MISTVQTVKGKKMRLIDADRLRQDVLAFQNNYNGFSDTYDKAQIIDTIDEQPTIDAVPLEDFKSMEQTVNKLTKAIAEAEPIRHGKWVYIGFMTVKCNNCGNIFHELAYTNYCPNCGAKMEEVK